jgi:hypothetical protein
MTVPPSAIEALGWLATATFIASYFFARPEALVRVQIAGGAMWIVYGVLVHATPVVAANLLVVVAAGWKMWRSGRTARGHVTATPVPVEPDAATPMRTSPGSPGA